MECGWSDHGEINDVDRKAYLFDHLNEVVKAIKYDGANVHSFSGTKTFVRNSKS